jgi:ParB-like chromosome segregation protein Spo0J
MAETIPLKWHTEKRKVKDLILYEENPREMTEKQKNDLLKSLKKFDLVEIPAIDTNNIVCAGNQRVMLLKLKGRESEEIDVRVPNRKLTDEEFREYNLRSNKNVAQWDLDLLEKFDKNLLKEIGWTAEELDEIFGLDIDEEFDVEKELNKVLAGKERRVKEGDIYGMGEYYICPKCKKEIELKND